MKRILAIVVGLLFYASVTFAGPPPPFVFQTNPALLLPTGCTNGYTATYNTTTNRWVCTAMSGSGDLKADGTVPLTAHWNVGAYNITASSFIGALTGNATTATALAANPTDCAAGQLATGIAANGDLTCSATPSLQALTLTGANTLGLGTAGSAVGSVNFKNATSGYITVQPITGALGTPTLVLGTTFTDAKWCSYATAAGLTCNEDAPAGSGDFKADGTVAMTGALNAAQGLKVGQGSTGPGYIQLMEDSDDGTNKVTINVPALAADYTLTLPSALGAANTLVGMNSGGTALEFKSTISATLDNAAAQFADSSVATKKMKIDPVGMTAGKTLTLKGSFDQSTTIDFVNTALSADDKTLTFAVPITDNATYTFPAATATLAILGANTFTALQTYDATAGIQVGATGVGITSDDDGAITFTGKSAGYDEDLTLNFDDTENTVVVSSSTGVTKIDFSALNLATTGIITGAVNTNSDANGMSSSEMTAAGMYGTMFWATGAGTWNLPGAATGMSFCVYSTTAAAIVINPDDGDTIVLNGTALSAGDSITSASGAGDFICLLAKDANTWYTLGRSGTWTDTN